jgi:hypothetical protein
MTAAHRNKAVMALDWKEAVEGDGNAGNGGWLASAGLDKTVKVSSGFRLGGFPVAVS